MLTWPDLGVDSLRRQWKKLDIGLHGQSTYRNSSFHIMAHLVTAKWVLRFGHWSMDASSKKSAPSHLTKRSFSGKLLDAAIQRVTGRKSGLTPQAKVIFKAYREIVPMVCLLRFI